MIPTMDSDQQSGDLLKAYGDRLSGNVHLVVMPITRIRLEWAFPCAAPRGMTFYPKYDIEMENLGIIKNNKTSNSLAEHVSAASGMDHHIQDADTMVVFPFEFDWNQFRRNSHIENTEFIRTLSAYVDITCLNYIKYQHCTLDDIFNLPGRAGTIYSNRMMAGALLYNHGCKEGRIIGGDPFSHCITKGLGLSLGHIDTGSFPKDGEVGNVLRHALMLYSALLDTENPTVRFTQAISLLEYLAYPNRYKNFKEVKKIIARYFTKETDAYLALLVRFNELTGQKDPSSSQVLGLRTRIIHMGSTLEQVVPDVMERCSLFKELDGYIRLP